MLTLQNEEYDEAVNLRLAFDIRFVFHRNLVSVQCLILPSEIHVIMSIDKLFLSNLEKALYSITILDF